MPGSNHRTKDGTLDETAKRRLSWIEKITDWSRGELKPLDIPPGKELLQITDSLNEFDGAQIEASFNNSEEAFSVSVYPTYHGRDTSYGVDALISPEDGEYRYVGLLVASEEEANSNGFSYETDALGEFHMGKWNHFPNDKGHRVAVEKFDSYLALIAARLDKSPARSN